MLRRDFLKSSALLAAASAIPFKEAFGAGAPIKIGILHSLSGTMAISERFHSDHGQDQSPFAQACHDRRDRRQRPV